MKDTNFQNFKKLTKKRVKALQKTSLTLGTAADWVSWGAAMQCGFSVTSKLGIVCTHQVVVVGCSCCMSSWHHFKRSYCPRWIAQAEQLFLLNCLTLKMESLWSFETSVTSPHFDTVLYASIHECSGALLWETQISHLCGLPYRNIKSTVPGQ